MTRVMMIVLAGSMMLGLAPTVCAAQAAETTLTYPLEVMVPRGQWRLEAWGDRGASAWEDKTLVVEYTLGAPAVLLRFAGRRDDLGDVFAARFEPTDGSRRKVQALWSAEKNAVVKIAAESPSGTLVNTIGETRTVTNRDSHFELRLRAGAPVYLVTE